MVIHPWPGTETGQGTLGQAPLQNRGQLLNDTELGV
jgi:hypothetical protein